MTVRLEDIEKARQRLQPVVIQTPLLHSAYLDSSLSARVLLKPENLQHIGAFKFRGAYNRLSQLDEKQRQQGVVAFSSGNHAQGIAYAAKLLQMPATIVMPADAPANKIAGTKNLGATLRLYDRKTESREAIAGAISEESGAVLVPSFEDLDVIAGQGTCGLEIVEQYKARNQCPDILLAPCGGGGLMAGVSTALKACMPDTQIYGVEPELTNSHGRSWQAGKRMVVDQSEASFCDALLAPIPGEITWSINSQTVDGFLSVSDDDVAYAISYAFRFLKLVIEPGGAVGLAAVLRNKLPLQGKRVCIVLSGGNIDSNTFSKCLQAYPSP